MHSFASGSIRFLGMRISKRRWPEFLIVASLMLTSVSISVAAGPRGCGLFGAGLGVLAILVAVIDRHILRIPDMLVICIALLGLLACVAFLQPSKMLHELGSAVARGTVFATPFMLLRQVYSMVRGREGLGLGDVKLAAAGGVWLDWVVMPVAMETAALSALLYCVARHHFAGETMKATARLPFALFLAPAIWAGWLIQSAQWPF